LQLASGELGPLAGTHFPGPACMQLPVGRLLDRYGARQVLLSLVLMALLGRRAAIGLLLFGNIAAGMWYWIRPRLSEGQRLVAARG
jgi:MFS family permease